MNNPDVYEIKREKDGKLKVDIGDKIIDVVESNYLLACHWLIERHKIWYKKEVLRLSQPWTTDEILHTWKFTNIHRKLDRGTQYIMNYLDTKTWGQYPDNLDIVFNIMRYRLFNNRHSHLATGGFTSYKEFDYDKWYKSLRDRWSQGDQVLCQAHNTCTYSGFPGNDKIERVCLVAKNIHDRTPMIVSRLMDASNMEEGFKIINSERGFGPFLSYEVMMDLSYMCPKFDAKTWANVGPGASRGLSYLFSGHTKKDELTLLKVLRDNIPFGIELSGEDLGTTLNILKTGSDQVDGSFDLRVPENWMCETSKYIKLFCGTGRSFGGTYKPSKS